MPPRKRQAGRPQVEVEPPGPACTNPGRPTRRSRRAQTRAPAVDRGERESFDLDDVSSGDNDDDDDYDDDILAANANHPTDESINNPTTSQEVDAEINDPHLPPPKVSTAADIHYFFKKESDKMVCVICK